MNQLNNKIIVLSGMSSSGKDSLQWKIAKVLGCDVIVSTTTRPKRPSEIDDVSYHFTDNESFQRMIDNNELTEHRDYHTLVNGVPAVWFYGCAFKDIPEDKQSVIVLDPIGLRGFREHYGNRVIAFFIDSPEDVRKARAKERPGFDAIEWDRRQRDDSEVFNFDYIYDEVDYVLFNGKNNTLDDLLGDFISCLVDPKEESMVRSNLSLVHFAIRNFKLEFLDEYEDLYQVGCIGLINAIRAFKPEMGVKFSSYAIMCIRNQIIATYRTAKARSEMLGNIISLDEPVHAETHETLLDRLPDDRYNALSEFNGRWAKEAAQTIIWQIEDDEIRDWAIDHFYQDKSYRVLAKESGCSHERIRKAVLEAIRSTKLAKEILSD